MRIGAWMQRKWKVVLLWPSVIVLCFLVAIFCEGIADFKADAASLVNMDAYPLFPQVRMRKMLRRIGMKEPKRENAVSIATSNTKLTSLCYPVSPIVRQEHAKYNIVWLVAESLRNDMLTEEIMPNTWNMPTMLSTVRNRKTMRQLMLSINRQARIGASICATPMPAPLIVINMGRSFSSLISPMRVR